jgi:antirestriction protein ArdC
MAEKLSVQSIVTERLIKKIQEEKRLPWQKPFQSACMNWYSKREYMGINKLLLDGGEYLTVNQLKAYNDSKKTNFWFESGTPWEIVVFYNKSDKAISDATANAIINDPKKNGNSLIRTPNGWVLRVWFLRYYRVYNIRYIKDKEGNILEPHIGNTIVEEHIPADEIIARYIKATGVGIKQSGSGAYYTHVTDNVYLPPKSYFASTEAYYRVLFHELTHSTGIKQRLDRSCFHQYHEGSRERSKEELIAEVGSLLLASEAGFRDDTQWQENSDNYIAGWCSWMKENQNELLNGMLAAEKAKNFILSGGLKAAEITERSIDNPDVGEESGELGEEPTSETPDSGVKASPSGIKALKTKKAVREYYLTNLSQYFTGKEAVLDTVTAIELKYIYYVLTKEKLPANKKKIEVLTLIKQCIESSSRVG